MSEVFLSKNGKGVTVSDLAEEVACLSLILGLKIVVYDGSC
jgi:hypothetical protein